MIKFFLKHLAQLLQALTQPVPTLSQLATHTSQTLFVRQPREAINTSRLWDVILFQVCEWGH